MKNWPWFLPALGAAVVWGLHYPLVDNALKRLSPATVLLITALPILALAAFMHRRVAADLFSLRQLTPGEFWPIAAIAATSLAGSLLLYAAIGAKNATLASVIEISYPLFVALFAWLLFRQIHWNAAVLVGGVLVFAGVTLIIVNSHQ
jgi:drug/metabolite transporter (DMT)-like permease